MRVLACVIGVAAAMGLGACGGTHRKAGAARPGPVRPRGALVPALALLLPASPAGPTTCTVYESGFATQVVFDSQSLNVTGECQAWASREPGAGYLWSYQPTGAALDETAVPGCDLRDPSGRVTATVIEDTGFAPASALQRAKIARACASLALAGWAPLRASHPGPSVS
jgi:hypothetical protein